MALCLIGFAMEEGLKPSAIKQVYAIVEKLCITLLFLLHYVQLDCLGKRPEKTGFISISNCLYYKELADSFKGKRTR
jgi:hypothetical protein